MESILLVLTTNRNVGIAILFSLETSHKQFKLVSLTHIKYKQRLSKPVKWGYHGLGQF